jgi:hypothetical protein
MNDCKQCEEGNEIGLPMCPECETAFEKAQGAASPDPDVVGYGVWNTGTNPGTRLQRYDGMVAISPNRTSYHTVPVYSEESFNRLQAELQSLRVLQADTLKQLEEAIAQCKSSKLEATLT